MIELTPADLPPALASMSTGAEITDAEMREILADVLLAKGFVREAHHVRDGALAQIWTREALAAMRAAVEDRAQQSTPASDALLQDVLLAIKRREAYPGELSYLERQLNEILIRTPVPARSPAT